MPGGALPMTKWLLSAALSLLIADVSAASGIDRLEPAFWWVGMKDSRLQLMVHGERIAELTPALEYPGVTIEGLTRTDNPNYLFIDLRLADNTLPGRFRIDFRRDKLPVLRHEYELLARQSGSAARAGFGPADVIYLITPDRFANGDPGNDGIKGYREGPNRRDPDGRHGGDLKGVLDHLDYLAGMGFTQLWLNPVLQNDQPQRSYHGYAITDYYQVDARFGDNALYRSLSLAARAKGIGLVMDMVLNHCGSEHWWMRDLPAKDWINHGGHFVGTSHNRESLQDPHGAGVDRDDMINGWFVPTMPDLNQRNPLLATYLIQNSLWWIEYAGLSGLRVDTWPYPDKDFLTEWARRVTEEYPALNIVGEEWSTNPAIVSYWQRGRPRHDGYASYLPGLMDFPLQDAAVRAFAEDESGTAGLIRIYRALANDSLYADPYNLVVFPDNHDMSRIFTQLGGRADLYKMALGYFLTTRGIPQLFYGDEILMANPGTDAHGVIRSDFPGGWAGDVASGFTGTGLTAPQRDAQEFTRKLLNWRKGASAIHRGKLTQYAPQGGIYVYFRHFGQLKVMVVINKAADEQQIDTARFHEVIGTSTHATDALSGQRHLLDQGIKVPGRSITILELQGDGSIPPGVTGRAVRHEKFASRYVGPRNVDVWLPPGYGKDKSKRYPVIYMHDGQNLFDPALSYIGVDWGIDETMTRLIREGAVREAIVVGVWNTPKRAAEYIPQKPLTEATSAASLPDVQELVRLPLESDNYLRFLVEELKPFIDSTYRTLPDRANTSIMGSSAGALISIYALTEYPEVFGGAGGVSTHWPLGDGIMIDYFEKHLPAPPGHLLYFDFGTATLDAAYEPYQRRVDALMRRSGYREGVDWMTRKVDGAEHSELAWRARVDVPLKFLLGR
jgi:neopullulanase